MRRASSRRCRRAASRKSWSGAATAKFSSRSRKTNAPGFVIRDLGFADEKPPESRVASPESRLADIVHERGPLTVAAFMDLALYHPELGYYARAAQRSGRAGDFFTSVDVGPLFGELLEAQLAEMFQLLLQSSEFRVQSFDLVEAGAGNGRLAADVLRAAHDRHPDFYAALRL